MRKLFGFCVVFIALVSLLPAAAATQGAALPSGMPSVDSVRIPHAGWEEVGLGSASGGGISSGIHAVSQSPSLAIAPDGTPYVAWQVSPKITHGGGQSESL